ncbi:MAG: hotdog fold thioesterase [Actinomycetia bacterium]|nr:hotdog fold thioesterase [Actinomycetes bacterium]
MTVELPPVPIHERLGIAVTSATADEVVGTLPVAGNEQPFGSLHGGASVVLAESLASIGSALHAGLGHSVVGIEVNATHHRAVRSGLITGRAVPQHLGRRIATWQVEMRDGDGKLTCTARVTCLLTPL